ncbi:MAG: hypothetical protein SOU49_08320 [Sodaliphilus pleomorphus]|uniref:hypothetical protein n=1 Tax=Sodaliphilus pleomorphus TaxID=2606626 RepID=UPI0023F36C63|nr:hypothetical protein [Sodaliphilus pleomorphus]MDD7065342.1 hypothetical protein [Sodaliphilus pleomorphus]MDY2832731.1 hypothetical protein [Sodaliphilus pleomorphus]
MANKRQLKKAIKYACGEIAGQCIVAANTLENTDVDQWDNIVINVALLQQEAVNRVSVDYDKTPSDFENRKAYNKARRAYFKQVEKALADYMHTQTEKVVEAMNALTPKAQK